MESFSPTVIPPATSSVSVFPVLPTLPEGLMLDSYTGQVSGTPETLEDEISYAVTGANNAGGVSTYLFTIAVNDVAPKSLAYAVQASFYL